MFRKLRSLPLARIGPFFVLACLLNCTNRPFCVAGEECSAGALLLLFSKQPVPGFAYFADADTFGGLNRIQIDADTGTLTDLGNDFTNFPSGGAVTHPELLFLYELRSGSPNHTLVTYVRNSETSTLREVYSLNINGSLTASTGTIAISTDGKYLATKDDANIELFSLSDAKRPKQIASINWSMFAPSGVYSLTFDPLNEFLFVGDSTNPVHVLTLSGNNLQYQSTTGATGGSDGLIVAKDNTIFFRTESNSPNGFIVLSLDRATGQFTELAPIDLSGNLARTMLYNSVNGRLYLIDTSYNFREFTISKEAPFAVTTASFSITPTGSGSPVNLGQTKNGSFLVCVGQNSPTPNIYSFDIRNAPIQVSNLSTGGVLMSSTVVDRKTY